VRVANVILTNLNIRYRGGKEREKRASRTGWVELSLLHIIFASVISLAPSCAQEKCEERKMRRGNNSTGVFMYTSGRRRYPCLFILCGSTRARHKDETSKLWAFKVSLSPSPRRVSCVSLKPRMCRAARQRFSAEKPLK
jgi:hypothetical protein